MAVSPSGEGAQGSQPIANRRLSGRSAAQPNWTELVPSAPPAPKLSVAWFKSNRLLACIFGCTADELANGVRTLPLEVPLASSRGCAGAAAQRSAGHGKLGRECLGRSFQRWRRRPPRPGRSAESSPAPHRCRLPRVA